MTLTPFLSYLGTQLYHLGSGPAYTYTLPQINLTIDADGAPKAYGPHDSGLDFLANAGYPGHGWTNCLVVDPHHTDQPWINPETGCYVSKTSLNDPTLPATDPARWVDATKVPYIVFPGAFFTRAGTGELGDFGYAKDLSSGLTSPFVVADIGPSHEPLGEISIALAAALGGQHPNPRTGRGVPPGPVQFIIFPNSRRTPAWPVPNIAAIADGYLTAHGGFPGK